jgi:hypothetical protein
MNEKRGVNLPRETPKLEREQEQEALRKPIKTDIHNWRVGHVIDCILRGVFESISLQSGDLGGVTGASSISNSSHYGYTSRYARTSKESTRQRA